MSSKRFEKLDLQVGERSVKRQPAPNRVVGVVKAFGKIGDSDV